MIVCSCNRIAEQDLRAAMREGYPTIDSAYRAMGCEFECGCCRDYAEELVADERRSIKPRLVRAAA